jgi:hypothetical protein
MELFYKLIFCKMKKRINIFAALLLMTTAGYSQIIRNDGMIVERPKFGIQGGLVVSNQTVSQQGSFDATDSKTSFTAGINLEIPLRYGLYLQPEINYSQMGGKGYVDFPTTDGTTASAYGTFNYSYIQVPILIKYRPLFSGFGVFLGPQYGYLLDAKGVNFNDGGPNVDFKPETYRSELSALFGLEYYFPSPNDGPQFGLSARYQAGITNISNTPGSYQSIHNNGLLFLTIGVRF